MMASTLEGRWVLTSDEPPVRRRNIAPNNDYYGLLQMGGYGEFHMEYTAHDLLQTFHESRPAHARTPAYDRQRPSQTLESFFHTIRAGAGFSAGRLATTR